MSDPMVKGSTRPDPWRTYLLLTRDQARAEADRLERSYHGLSEPQRLAVGARFRAMMDKLRYDANVIESLIRGFDVTGRGAVRGDVAPCRGDAVKARCASTGRWMGGVVADVDVREGWVCLVAGRYALADVGRGVQCRLEGATVARGTRVFVETYRDSDSAIYEEVRP